MVSTVSETEDMPTTAPSSCGATIRNASTPSSTRFMGANHGTFPNLELKSAPTSVSRVW
jgi:hypothetical protein